MKVEEGLTGWLELEATGSRRKDRLAGLHRSMSLLKEAEVNPGHRLHSLLEPYRHHKAVASQAEVARQRLEAFVGECERMGTLQSRALAAISGHQMNNWEQEAARLLEQSLGRGQHVCRNFFLLLSIGQFFVVHFGINCDQFFEYLPNE